MKRTNSRKYSIGLDALGKPPTYDPRQDAGVRLQASRLRQKLDEYYRGEGRNDPLIVETASQPVQDRLASRDPGRGHCVRSANAARAARTSAPNRWRSLAIGLALVLLILVCDVSWLILRPSLSPAPAPGISKLTPDLEALWNPFLTSKHHLFIVFSDPVFAAFQRQGSPDILYRQRDVNVWEDMVAAPEFSLFSKSLGDPVAKPNFDYATRGELMSTFALSQFFAGHRGDISVARLGNISWQQSADNDLILLAARDRIGQQQEALPVRPAFAAQKGGIVNLHPLAGELPVYANQHLHPGSDGETYELVSLLPGPMGRTAVAGFTGGLGWGVLGAVQSLTDPEFARIVAQKLRAQTGAVPRFYQLVLKIKYRDGTPIDVSYITHRALTAAP